MKAFFGIGIKSAILAIALTGCATAARSNTYGLDLPRATLVRQTCQDVMGIEPGLAQFNACADVLAQSLQRMGAAQRLAGAHAACLRQGKTEGTADLAACVLSGRAQSVANTAPQVPVAQARSSRNSYFRMDRAARLEHEQRACAQLGLDPINHAFDECVVALSEAFFDFDNPL